MQFTNGQTVKINKPGNSCHRKIGRVFMSYLVDSKPVYDVRVDDMLVLVQADQCVPAHSALVGDYFQVITGSGRLRHYENQIGRVIEVITIGRGSFMLEFPDSGIALYSPYYDSAHPVSQAEGSARWNLPARCESN